MDQRYLQMLEICRPQLHQVSDVEQLLPYLQAGDAVTAEELGVLRAINTKEGRVDKILDIVSRKGPQAFSALCVALESTYPHILTLMFNATAISGDPAKSPDRVFIGAANSHPLDRDFPLTSSLPRGSDLDFGLVVSSPITHQAPDFPLRSPTGHGHLLDHEFGLLSSSLGPPPTGLPPPIPVSGHGEKITGKESQNAALTLDSEEDGSRSSALLAAKSSRPDDSSPSSSTTSGRSSMHSRPVSQNDYDLGHDNFSLLKAELKVVGKNSDHHQHHRHHRHHPQLPEQAYLEPKMAQMTLRSPETPTEVKLPSPPILPQVGHDYDRIKAECDRMNRELQSLEKKYDQAMKTSNMYRQQFKVTKDKLEEVSAELEVTKSQRNEAVDDKKRLDSEVVQLKKLRDDDNNELTELRRQHQKFMSESGSFDGFSAIYDQAVNRYESLKIDYDELRKQYSDTAASLNAGSGKLDRLKDENEHLRKKCEKLELENASANKKHNILQQHVTSAIQATNREKNDLLRELQDMKMERDGYRKKSSSLDAQALQMSKDLSLLRKERDAAVHEYTLVMSERSTVHKEMEQLQDKLAATEKKSEANSKEKKAAMEELETLQREVHRILEMRDQAINQLNELQDNKGERRLDPTDFDRLLPERGSGRRDQTDMVERRDHDKEIEAIRKELEKIQTELNDTLQEKDDCKRRCDWAFSERDKIVRERESIRTLCDKLRHERDNAVSKLIEALRDTDELKKQKLDAVRELKDTKEKYEALLEKESRKGQLHAIGHNHSHDSAIDADLQEWETETLQLEIGDVTVPDLGIDLVGGKEDPQFPDNAVFIANVRQDSCAWGKLKVNDQLVKVNNVEITNVEKSVLYQAIHNSGSTVQMMVRRRRMVSTRCILPVNISLSDSSDLGVQLESGVYVCRIQPGSAAAKEGNLAVGDRIVSVNGQSLENRTIQEAMQLADSQGDHVTFNIIKYNLTPQSSVALSSTPSSGHNLTESSPDGLSLSPRSPQLHHHSWASQSPDSGAKGNLSLKCSGSQTDSLDSPPPSMHGGWADVEKSSRAFPRGHDYERDRKSSDPGTRDLGYGARREVDYTQGMPQKDYMSGSVNRRRSRDKEHRSHDRDQERGSVHDPQDGSQKWSHGHSSRSRDLVDQRNQESQDQRHSYDMDKRRPHDNNDFKQSHDMSDQRRTHGSRDLRKSNGESEKRNVFEKNMSQFQRSSQSTDRATRDSRCKSGHPLFSTTEDEVIGEFNAMITKYEKQPSSNKKEKRKRGTKRENGGTWPKCREHVDHTHPVWCPPAAHKERPALANLIEDTTKYPVQSSYGKQDGNMPPTPPERNESFKRSASIKHSPQSSDSSKYSHHSLSLQSKTMPAQSSSYHSSLSKATNHASTLGHDSPNKSKSDSSWGDSSQQQSYNKSSSSSHYPTAHSPEPQASDNMDYSVKSADNKLEKMYIRQQIRPISAPNNARGVIMRAMRADDRRSESGERQHGHRSTSRSRDKEQKLQEIAEMLYLTQTSEVQKPTSLDIQPMYSPRPIPHTAKTITPSHPVTSPSYSQPPTARSGQGTTVSGSGPFSPREKANQPYPSSVSAQTQVMRSPHPLFQVANSQIVSPHGSGSISGLPTTPSPMSSQPLISRYSSPTGPYSRGSGSSILNSSIPEVESENSGVYHIRDRLSTPSPSPSQQSSNFDHSVATSDDFPYDVIQQRSIHGRHSHHTGYADGTSTLPNRRPNHHHPERICIPSNQSISQRSMTSSFERVSGRSSPVSPAYLSTGQLDHPLVVPGTTHSLPSKGDQRRRARPRPGETREIKVEKSMEPLGIQIQSGTRGGIFVSSVSDNSLASRAGITVGDQLLEVCGINMRKATKDLAASVLRQCGGSVNMLVQYKPSMYQDDGEGSSGPSTASSDTNTPDISQNPKAFAHHVSNETLTSDTVSPQTLSPNSVSPIHSAPPVEPRFVMLKKSHLHENLGITLLGGNSVGIFVRSVQPNSVSGGQKGLRYGDQILEYNGMNFRSVTHEQALVEISKPAEVVSILAQYNIQRLNKILDQPGDALYIRALFDHQSDNDGELSFSRNDILFVDSTMYNGQMGVWRAWRVDDAGNKLQCGTVPSKSRLEEELSLKRSQSEGGEDDLSKSSRRGSASARRSFFRKKKHQRSNSRDSRELNSFSDASINSDFLDDGAVLTFERVERLDSKVCRPVLLLAPHAEPINNKLTSESPDKYCRCEPEVIKATMSSLETGQNDGLFVDFKARTDGQFECVTVQSVKDIISKNRHCMLSAHPTAIEHLHKVNIYPIVLFVKHKTSKEIREVKDTRFLPEKLSNKSVKELYDTFQKYEQKYKRMFSEVLPGGNLAYMCRMVKTAIDTEQKKTLWVPSGYL